MGEHRLLGRFRHRSVGRQTLRSLRGLCSAAFDFGFGGFGPADEVLTGMQTIFRAEVLCRSSNMASGKRRFGTPGPPLSRGRRGYSCNSPCHFGKTSRLGFLKGRARAVWCAGGGGRFDRCSLVEHVMFHDNEYECLSDGPPGGPIAGRSIDEIFQIR